MIEPDEVRDPICVGVTGDDKVVADVVVVEGLKCTVAVRLVAIPCVVW